jgi:hypothetical protein
MKYCQQIDSEYLSSVLNMTFTDVEAEMLSKYCHYKFQHNTGPQA